MIQKNHQAPSYIFCIHSTFQEIDIYSEQILNLTQPALTPSNYFLYTNGEENRDTGGIIFWILGIILCIFKKMAETFSKTLVSLKGLSNFRRQIGIDEVKEN